ncbi:MAG TPA: hypothetical protein VFO48_00165 [Vicinamibacterales bacterium]|nr:hypothetical protein [Vicinamibacterales bacterium]
MTEQRGSAAELFDAVWASLRDVLGPTATATLVGRSIRRARARHPQLDEIAIVQRHFEYTYTLPPAWKTADTHSRAQLKAVVEELWPLLSSLTGTLVLKRLGSVPLLLESGVMPADARRDLTKDAKR